MWMKYLKPFRKQATIGFFFKMIEAMLELLVPIVVANIIDNGISHHDTGYIWSHGILLFVLAFVGYACALVCQYFASYTSQSFGTYLRNDMFKAINAYDFENIDDMTTPSLMTRMTNDVNQLQLAVAMAIRLVSRSPILIIGSLIMAFMIDVKMALIFFVSAPLLALSIYLVISKSLPIYLKIQKQLDRVSMICRENLSGIRVIKAFSKQEYEQDKFLQATKKQKDMQIRVGKLSALLNPCTNIIVNIAIICILYIGGLRVNIGSLTQGEVIALINYMNQILLSMFVFANVIVIFNKASASYKRVQEVLDVEPSIHGGSQIQDEQYQNLVLFDEVSFCYKNAKALDHISFDMKKGETIGIIGGTGSGKSTLVQLICHFYKASKGRIYIKDIPIEDYDIKELRKMIGISLQQSLLFSGTIEDNLKMAYPQASSQDIQDALDIAQAHFVYDLPQGLSTKIEQGGKNLSGGQRQRLTMARALVKKPELLILDDSSSALDYVTDAKLKKAIANIHLSTIIVSQRVSSLMHADKILVLSHGELVGIGNHEELMKSCDIYKEIASSQSMGVNL